MFNYLHLPTIKVNCFSDVIIQRFNFKKSHDVCRKLRGRTMFMTMYDFQLLPEPRQIELLYKAGVYIGKRREGVSIILLYQFESFYVEVFYRKYRSHIKRLHCFESTELLDPYLEQIDVENLV